MLIATNSKLNLLTGRLLTFIFPIPYGIPEVKLGFKQIPIILQ